MEEKPILISIIVPTYNRAKILEGTLQSIASQSFTDWECIVVDDRSTEAISEVVAEFSLSDPRFHYTLNTRQKGAQGARNHGFLESKGKYIYFFDSDNRMLPNCLEEMYLCLLREKTDVCCAFAEVIDEKGNSLSTFQWVNEGDIFQALLAGTCYVDFNISLYTRESIEAISMLDEHCPSYQEFETNLRLSNDHSYATLQKVLVQYVRRVESISGNPELSLRGYFYVLEKHLSDFIKIPGTAEFHANEMLSAVDRPDTRTLAAEYENRLQALIPGYSFQPKNHQRISFLQRIKHTIKRLLGR